MKDSQRRAEVLLLGAEGLFDRQDRNSHNIGELASMATAHAVLALHDLIKQDVIDYDDNAQLHRRIAQLEEELEASRAALRAREEADAAEMKAAQEANAADETNWKSPYAP